MFLFSKLGSMKYCEYLDRFMYKCGQKNMLAYAEEEDKEEGIENVSLL